MRLSQKKIRSFRKMIFSWWQGNRRDLPWRRTHDPYRILISEVMLQQTQVSRVLPIYNKFLDEFPDVHTLASASPAHVLKLWKGMGYNRRALYLQKTAMTVSAKYGGKFPADVSLLESLPGIGLYTAAAIAVFAFNKQLAVVDTNVRQIITHFFFDGTKQKPAVITLAAYQLLPKGRAWEWHQALMDYGALALKSQLPRRRKSNSPIVPFLQSKRFFRGRIIDRLREGQVARTAYIRELEKVYDKPRAFFQDIIAALVHEGMVSELADGRLELPTLPDNF